MPNTLPHLKERDILGALFPSARLDDNPNQLLAPTSKIEPYQSSRASYNQALAVIALKKKGKWQVHPEAMPLAKTKID